MKDVFLIPKSSVIYVIAVILKRRKEIMNSQGIRRMTTSDGVTVVFSMQEISLK